MKKGDILILLFGLSTFIISGIWIMWWEPNSKFFNFGTPIIFTLAVISFDIIFILFKLYYTDEYFTNIKAEKKAIEKAKQLELKRQKEKELQLKQYKYKEHRTSRTAKAAQLLDDFEKCERRI